jgi:chemotaxis protein CheD
VTALAEVHLPAGDFHFGGGRVRVRTLLGTCVAIAIWHPIERIGGICHYLLPTRGSARADDGTGPGLYADEVMILFADALRTSRTRPRDYVVKIAGGGNMFPDQLAGADCRDGGCSPARRAGCQSVGCRNIHAARALLPDVGFTIASESVGGNGSRVVMFDLWSGEVWVKRGAAMTGGREAA